MRTLSRTRRACGETPAHLRRWRRCPWRGAAWRPPPPPRQRPAAPAARAPPRGRLDRPARAPGRRRSPSRSWTRRGGPWRFRATPTPPAWPGTRAPWPACQTKIAHRAGDAQHGHDGGGPARADAKHVVERGGSPSHPPQRVHDAAAAWRSRPGMQPAARPTTKASTAPARMPAREVEDGQDPPGGIAAQVMALAGRARAPAHQGRERGLGETSRSTKPSPKPSAFRTATSAVRSRTAMAMVFPVTSSSVENTTQPMAASRNWMFPICLTNLRRRPSRSACASPRSSSRSGASMALATSTAWSGSLDPHRVPADEPPSCTGARFSSRALLEPELRLVVRGRSPCRWRGR